ncbi:hypothetical protein HK098_000091 [Nowakowskiella sp. JEL0407]|nr:hypothetical protein HK098_000091 [Nowakowskiella sp. JEL0407]
MREIFIRYSLFFCFLVQFSFAEFCSLAQTDSKCVDQYKFVNCFADNQFGPPQSCATGTVCKDQIYNGIQKVYCGWPSTSPNGFCNRTLVDSICISDSSYAHCYEQNTLSQIRDCGNGTRCSQSSEDNVTRVHCVAKLNLAIREIAVDSFEDYLSSHPLKPRDDAQAFPVGCDPDQIYSVCLNERSYAQCLSSKILSSPLNCGPKTVCTPKSYDSALGVRAGIFCDWPKMDGSPESTVASSNQVVQVTETVVAGNESFGSTATISDNSGAQPTDSTTQTSTTTTSVFSQFTNFNPPASSSSNGDVTVIVVADESGNAQSTITITSSPSPTGVSSNDSGDNTVYPSPGDKCDPQVYQGRCVGRDRYSLCAAGNILSESNVCSNTTICQEVKNGNVYSIVCGYGPDESKDNSANKINAGDPCDFATTASQCLSETAFAHCFATGYLGPQMDCGKGSVCHEISGNKTQVVCGQGEGQKTRRSPALSSQQIEAIRTSAKPGSYCNGAQIYSVCLNETVWLQCWADNNWGPEQHCGSGTVCIQDETRDISGIYCGWPKNATTSLGTFSTASSTSNNVSETDAGGSETDLGTSESTRAATTSTGYQVIATTASPTPKLQRRNNFPIATGSSCNTSDVDSICLDSYTYAHCLGVQVLGPQVTCGYGTECMQLKANGVLRVYCGWGSKTSGSTYDNDMTCKPDLVISVCSGATTFSLCDSDSMKYTAPQECGEGTVCRQLMDGNKLSAYCGTPAAENADSPPSEPSQATYDQPKKCDIKTTNSVCLGRKSFGLCKDNGDIDVETNCGDGEVCASAEIDGVSRVFCAYDV